MGLLVGDKGDNVKALKMPFDLTLNLSIGTTSWYEEIVRYQVIDALMTNQGERIYRPEYGCDIQSALFDPSDVLVRSDAANYIKGRLQGLVPRAIIETVVIESPDNEPGVVYVNVEYRVSAFQDSTSLQVQLSSEFLRRSQTV